MVPRVFFPLDLRGYKVEVGGKTRVGWIKYAPLLSVWSMGPYKVNHWSSFGLASDSLQLDDNFLLVGPFHHTAGV